MKKKWENMSLAQRKFINRKKIEFEDHSKCSCGGKIIEKDHGSWIGWYCPKCKSGGSRNK